MIVASKHLKWLVRELNQCEHIQSDRIDPCTSTILYNLLLLIQQMSTNSNLDRAIGEG